MLGYGNIFKQSVILTLKLMGTSKEVTSTPNYLELLGSTGAAMLTSQKQHLEHKKTNKHYIQA